MKQNSDSIDRNEKRNGSEKWPFISPFIVPKKLSRPEKTDLNYASFSTCLIGILSKACVFIVILYLECKPSCLVNKGAQNFLYRDRLKTLND